MGAPSDRPLVQPHPDDSLPCDGRESARREGAPDAPSSNAPPAAPPGSLPPGLRDELDALVFAWGDAYAIAGCVQGLAQTWTAVRLDTAAVLTAGGSETLVHLIRADYRACPVPRRDGLRDYLLERLRARYPGWAIVSVDQGVLAVRGATAVGPLPQQAMGCELADIAVRESRHSRQV
ncbi:MAG TPA: hypothetical protein VFW50_11955 [Streptosporangiaceae bacterium]|nr:hypothetical protein [Streptosporangiaceae bacterium]